MPFAVVGSNTLIEICGKKVRGRLYPWGVVEGKILKGNTVNPLYNCYLGEYGQVAVVKRWLLW